MQLPTKAATSSRSPRVRRGLAGHSGPGAAMDDGIDMGPMPSDSTAGMVQHTTASLGNIVPLPALPTSATKSRPPVSIRRETSLAAHGLNNIPCRAHIPHHLSNTQSQPQSQVEVHPHRLTPPPCTHLCAPAHLHTTCAHTAPRHITAPQCWRRYLPCCSTASASAQGEAPHQQGAGDLLTPTDNYARHSGAPPTVAKRAWQT